MNTQHRRKRQGVAAVEFAVCLPLLMIVTFGAIETANKIFLKQMLTQVAHEGARVVTLTGGTEAQAQQRCQEFATARGIQNLQVKFDPPVDASTTPGTPISVELSAPANSNSLGPQWYDRESVVVARVVMVRL